MIRTDPRRFSRAQLARAAAPSPRQFVLTTVESRLPPAHPRDWSVLPGQEVDQQRGKSPLPGACF
jgi:hypothetical protein